MAEPFMPELEKIAQLICAGADDDEIVDHMYASTSHLKERSGQLLMLEVSWSLLRFLHESGRPDVVELLAAGAGDG